MTHWGLYWKVKKKHTAKAVCDYKQFVDSFEIMKMTDFIGFTAKSNERKELLHSKTVLREVSGPKGRCLRGSQE